MQPDAVAWDNGPLGEPIADPQAPRKKKKKSKKHTSSKRKRKSTSGEGSSSLMSAAAVADGVSMVIPALNPYGVAQDGSDDDSNSSPALRRTEFQSASPESDDEQDPEEVARAIALSRSRRRSSMGRTLNRRKSVAMPKEDQPASAARGGGGGGLHEFLALSQQSSRGFSMSRGQRRRSVVPPPDMNRRRHPGAGGGAGAPMIADRLTRDPTLTVKQQFEAWSRGGKRKITLADDIADAFAPQERGFLDGEQVDVPLGYDQSMALGAANDPSHTREQQRVFGGELSGRFEPADVANQLFDDDVPDEESPRNIAQRRMSMAPGEGSGLFSRSSVSFFATSGPSAKRKKSDAISKKRRRAMLMARGAAGEAIKAADNAETEDELPEEALEEELTAAEAQLMEAAGVTLPVTAVIARLKQEVDEMDTLQDCTVFIPFLALFLASFLLSIDITRTHFVVNSLRGVDIDGQFEYAAAHDAALRRDLLRGDPLAVFATQPPLPGFGPGGNNSGNATAGSTTAGQTAPPSEWAYETASWSEAPVQWLLETLGLTNPIYHRTLRPQTDPILRVQGLEPGFMEIGSAVEFMSYMRDVFIPNNWPCSPHTLEHAEQVPTRLGSTLLLGAARLRILRMRPDSCRVSPRVLDRRNLTTDDSEVSLDFGTDEALEQQYREFEAGDLAEQSRSRLRCYAPYDSDGVETRDFCNERNPATANETLFRFIECRGLYDEMERSRYPCDGYTIDLPFNATCRSMQELMDLVFPAQTEQQRDFRDATHQTVALDRGFAPYAQDGSACDSIFAHESTRFVALEYMLLSKPTETFHRVSFLLEVTAGGSWTPLYVSRVFEVWNSTFILRTVFDIVILFGAFFFVGKFFRDWKQFRWRTGAWLPFIFDMWNILEAANLVTFIVTLSLRWAWRALSASVDVADIENGNFPAELDTVSALYSSSRFANATNLVLSFLKILKYAKLNERLGILTRTLAATQSHIIAVLLLFAAITTGYAIAGVQLYGMFLDDYRNVNSAFSSLFFLLLGQLDYEAMRVVQPLLTFSFFFSFVILGLFLMLNFAIVILSEGFAEEAQNMNVLPLSESVMRALEVARLILRPAYLVEFIKRRFYERSRLSFMKQAVDTLERHHHLMLTAFVQGTVSAPEPVMDFEDVEWWLPRDVFDGLGRLFLMTLWEDCVFQRRWEQNSTACHERLVLRSIIQQSIGVIVGRCMVDVDLLDAHADRVDDKMGTLLPQLPSLAKVLDHLEAARLARDRKQAEEEDRLRKLAAATERAKGTGLGPRFGRISLRVAADMEDNPLAGIGARRETVAGGGDGGAAGPGDEQEDDGPGDFISSRAPRRPPGATDTQGAPTGAIRFRAASFSAFGSGGFPAEEDDEEADQNGSEGGAASNESGGGGAGFREPSGVFNPVFGFGGGGASADAEDAGGFGNSGADRPNDDDTPFGVFNVPAGGIFGGDS